MPSCCLTNQAPNFLARKHGDDTCNEHGNSWDKGDTATDMRCFRSENIPGEPVSLNFTSPGLTLFYISVERKH